MTPTNLPGPAPVKPWYRHPWVWALIAVPGSSILFGIVMITASVSGPTDLVRDDYYKAGLAINQDLSGVRRAEDLGIVATLTPRTGSAWLLVVETRAEVAREATAERLEVQFQHPTLAARDVTLTAEAVAPGRWAATVPGFEGPRMLTARPATGDWVLRREVRLPEDPATVRLEARGNGAS